MSYSGTCRSYGQQTFFGRIQLDKNFLMRNLAQFLLASATKMSQFVVLFFHLLL